MQLINTETLNGPVAWSGPTFAGFAGAAVKLRWIDKPYRWHRNDGREFFMVLSGLVEMKVRKDGGQTSVFLRPGEAILIEMGEEHVAHPRQPSRILVVEAADVSEAD